MTNIVRAYIEGAEKQKKKDEAQLTKAKETLKSISELVSELYASGYSSKKIAECIQDKIEQFLNSEVEK